jgi:sec-independent protein translocase protein TatC
LLTSLVLRLPIRYGGSFADLRHRCCNRSDIRHSFTYSIPWTAFRSSGSSCPSYGRSFWHLRGFCTQVWAFIAPGLYRHERRWAGPLLVGSSGLFILGGVFAYFVVFRYGLTFLLSIAKGNFVVPMVPMDIYFERFVDVVLGVGILFELPVLIFLLTALAVVTPGFLLRHSRYAILAIFILAAVVTPSTEVFNLMLFATPMCVLFYLGVFASYLLMPRREDRGFPWRPVIWIAGGAAAAGGAAWAIDRYWRRR